MSKRPAIDLAALTSEAAAPMTEASQRAARPAPVAVPHRTPASGPAEPATKTANLQALAFKVSPGFRKRFQHSAPSMPISSSMSFCSRLDA